MKKNHSQLRTYFYIFIFFLHFLYFCLLLLSLTLSSSSSWREQAVIIAIRGNHTHRVMFPSHGATINTYWYTRTTRQGPPVSSSYPVWCVVVCLQKCRCEFDQLSGRYSILCTRRREKNQSPPRREGHQKTVISHFILLFVCGDVLPRDCRINHHFVI